MLTDSLLHRYARQILLPEVGGKGQEKLAKARVLCVGLGGLGSPVALYLAAAGVGTLGLLDSDAVELSNLHRQILHFTPDVGSSKVASAREKLALLNPEVHLVSHPQRLTQENAEGLISSYDVVVDGSDNFSTRYLVNDICVRTGRTLISGAVLRWEGHVGVFLPEKGPCYRCIFPEPPDPEAARSCSEAGLLGPAAGVVAGLQALETMKAILGTPGLTGRLLAINLISLSFRQISFTKKQDCSACGKNRISLENPK